MELSKDELLKLLKEKQEYKETCKTELIAVTGQIQLLEGLLAGKIQDLLHKKDDKQE